MTVLKASIYCAYTVVVAFFIVMFVRDESEIEFSKNLLLGMAMGGMLVWFIGFIFCFVLLLPLIQVFKRFSLGFSFVLFVFIGFFISALLGYFAATMPAHGEIPELYKPDNSRAIMAIVSLGFVGALGAFSAWFSLKEDMSDEHA